MSGLSHNQGGFCTHDTPEDEARVTSDEMGNFERQYDAILHEEMARITSQVPDDFQQQSAQTKPCSHSPYQAPCIDTITGEALAGHTTGGRCAPIIGQST